MSWKPFLCVLISGCAVNAVGMGGGELGEEEERDAGRDASTRRDASQDASRRDGSAPRSDASVVKGCEGDTPHGCYTLSDDSPEGCPEKAPEIPLGLPPLNEWDLCNNLAVTAGQTCVWEGPNGATASCLCDTGVHWLCVYL